jgi:hypothetical protein
MERDQSSRVSKISTAPSSNATSRARPDLDAADMHVVGTTKHLDSHDAQLFIAGGLRRQ